MVDVSRIEELKAEIGEEDLIMVFGMFLAEAGKTIDLIETPLQNEDHAKATHFLRSGALNIGLVSFAAAADKAAACPPDARQAMAAMLRRSLSDAVDGLGFPVTYAQDKAAAI